MTRSVRVALVLVSLGATGTALAQPVVTTEPVAATAEVRPALGRHFEAWNAEGAFVLFDRARNQYVRYNLERCATGLIPASTFKILNALIALETGAVADAQEVLPWDGVQRGFDGWNRDHTLETAFRQSAVWFYQEMARRIGAERMQAYVDRVGYGNRDLAGGLDRFWLTGRLRITPDEQVALLRRLHAGTLPFSPATQETVRGMMELERTERYVLRGKTGWAYTAPDEPQTGWLVGYLEQEGNTYFFATALVVRDPAFDMVAARRAITHGILEELGLR